MTRLAWEIEGVKKIFEFYSIRKLGRFLDGRGRIRSICLEWSPRMKRGGR